MAAPCAIDPQSGSIRPAAVPVKARPDLCAAPPEDSTMLREHCERQRKLYPLFSPELQPLRAGFAKSLRETWIIFTVVFWVGISFMYGAGYDTFRHIKTANYIFCNFDNSPEASALSSMIIEAFESPTVPRLQDATGTGRCRTTYTVDDAVWRGDAWGAVYVHEGFGRKLRSALLDGAEYDPTEAATLGTQESRHYLKVSTVNRVSELALAAVEGPFAQLTLGTMLTGEGVNATEAIDRANPQAIVLPFSFKVKNIAPLHFDTSMYIMSITLSLCMVAGSFIPSNMWKTIEEVFYKRLKVKQLVLLRLIVNTGWAAFICIQAAGILCAFRGPSWSPGAREFFGLFGIFLLNTMSFTFFIDCLQNWLHPRFLLATYFMVLAVNISAAVFGRELNNSFFDIVYATPFSNTGITARYLLTNGSFNRLDFSITINVLWMVIWWFISTFLIARKARLVKSGALTMAN
ncbi:hypothetical protein LPJ61_005603, partial [Coemansia biformis]